MSNKPTETQAVSGREGDTNTDDTELDETRPQPRTTKPVWLDPIMSADDTNDESATTDDSENDHAWLEEHAPTE